MKIYKYKDNVDTDVIIPARYLNSFDAKELASHAMADIDPTFATTVEKSTSTSSPTSILSAASSHSIIGNPILIELR